MSKTYVCENCGEIVSTIFGHNCNAVPKPDLKKKKGTYFIEGIYWSIQDIEALIKQKNILEQDNAHLQAQLETRQRDINKCLYDIRELSGKNVILTDAVRELKSILFQKELSIAQNSGYIARVRELDPVREERLLTVPESKVVSQQYTNQASPMAAEHYNTWGLRWWDLGNEKKKDH